MTTTISTNSPDADQEAKFLKLGIDSDGIDFLTQQSQLLWRETTLEKLLNRFIEIHKDCFGLTKAALFHLRPAPTGLALERAVSDVKGLSEFEPSLIKSLEQTLSTLNLKAQDVRQGLNSIHCSNVEVEFALVGDPAADWQMLAWQVGGHPDASLQGILRTYSDFLVRQLQSAYMWFHRLDKTQALLFRDDLTGVFNSRYLEVAIDSEIRRSQRFEMSFCLLFIDLDNFKMVNDKFGHLCGSAILRQLADVLREASREVDSVIRYGGDEFVILLLGATPATGVLAAERMRRRIEDTKFYLDDGNHVSLTASIGVAAFPEHAADRDALLKIADEMMYTSKRQGKNRVTIFKVLAAAETTDKLNSLISK